MPTKKTDVVPEEMAPQAEEMVTPEDASPQTDSENGKPGATRTRKAKKPQKNPSLTRSLKTKTGALKTKAFQRENALIPDRQ